MTPAVKAQILEYVESFVTAAILAAVIIIFIGQNFLVQGSSMEPNFHDRERLFVEKISYRFREPQRGEVVVFKYPAHPRRKFIKRVVGVPGDEIKIRDTKVYINGVQLEEDYLDSITYGEFYPVYVPQDTSSFWETTATTAKTAVSLTLVSSPLKTWWAEPASAGGLPPR